MIKLQGINKKFGDKVVLKNISMQINSNEFVGIKGESGSGKTTLLNILGLLDEFEGEYFLDDTKIIKENMEVLRYGKLSYIFQNPYLLEYLDVYNNVIMPLKNLKIKLDEKHIDDILKQLSIFELKNKSVALLSGGERSRVAIARALLLNPSYIFADEPTGNLDEVNTKKVMDILKDLNKNLGITIIMVTHSTLLDSYFDKIYQLKDGEIYE